MCVGGQTEPTPPCKKTNNFYTLSPAPWKPDVPEREREILGNISGHHCGPIVKCMHVSSFFPKYKNQSITIEMTSPSRLKTPPPSLHTTTPPTKKKDDMRDENHHALI